MGNRTNRKKASPIELAAKQTQNNCEIIRRLACGDLDEEEMASIGESLATGRTLEEIGGGHNLGSIFG